MANIYIFTLRKQRRGKETKYWSARRTNEIRLDSFFLSSSSNFDLKLKEQIPSNDHIIVFVNKLKWFIHHFHI